MTGRRNPDGTLAFFVENYIFNSGVAYGYSQLNLDAAIVRDPKSLLFVNAIEVSPGPSGGVSFAKFFNFNGSTGARDFALDLDGRGKKFMPGPCVTCHGGRGDALVPDATGKLQFARALNAVSDARGDVLGQLAPFEVDALDFSTTPGFTRADQEVALKALNKIVLCSYPLPADSVAPEDACRRPAGPAEWRGSAAALIKSAYGGDGLPNATYADNDIPFSWLAAGQSTLYRSVVATSCRMCHLLRGTGAQSDIDFATFDKFASFADRTRAHVLDRGNMPLAKAVFDAFYAAGSRRPEILANFLEDEGFTARDATGAVFRPGRPVADPGPDRAIGQGATRLSATDSLFANGYAWSIVTGPNGTVPAKGATLTNANTAQPVFNATLDGTYVLSLVVSNGATHSTAKTVTLVVDSTLVPLPSAVSFADIKALLQGGGGCTTCHSAGIVGVLRPPVSFRNEDHDGDASLYADVRGRVNFTELAASPLLRKPAGEHHAGGRSAGFDAGATPGQPARANYDLILDWILNGAPR
jgi:cytochrome c5